MEILTHFGNCLNWIVPLVISVRPFLGQACSRQADNFNIKRIVIYCRYSRIRRESSQAKEKKRIERMNTKRKEKREN